MNGTIWDLNKVTGNSVDLFPIDMKVKLTFKHKETLVFTGMVIWWSACAWGCLDFDDCVLVPSFRRKSVESKKVTKQVIDAWP